MGSPWIQTYDRILNVWLHSGEKCSEILNHSLHSRQTDHFSSPVIQNQNSSVNATAFEYRLFLR
jgi:hypothetical protein